MRKNVSRDPENSHNLFKNNLTGVYTEKNHARYRENKKLVSGKEFFCIGPCFASKKQVVLHFGICEVYGSL
jgi:hypothetical protein